jgi:hypothetical protein
MNVPSGVMTVYDRHQKPLGTVQDFGPGRILACRITNNRAQCLGFFADRGAARAAIEGAAGSPAPPEGEAA